VVIYYRKEGRALGEVTKYLVYNMRKRQEGGDQAKEYFNCTQHVAGVTDSRFQVNDFFSFRFVSFIEKSTSLKSRTI
jgi:hypothetical protein